MDQVLTHRRMKILGDMLRACPSVSTEHEQNLKKYSFRALWLFNSLLKDSSALFRRSFSYIHSKLQGLELILFLPAVALIKLLEDAFALKSLIQQYIRSVNNVAHSKQNQIPFTYFLKTVWTVSLKIMDLNQIY